MTDEGHVVEGNDSNAHRLTMLMHELVALLKAHDVAGFVVLALPGNAEVRVHLDASWQAVYIENDRMMCKDESTFEQQANSCNVLKMLASLTATSSQDMQEAAATLRNAMNVDVVGDGPVRHSPLRKPN